MLIDIPRGFYVYVLIDPATDKIFYVGKGIGRRIRHHESEARGKCGCRKCEKIGEIWKAGREVKRAIVFTTADEQAAYNHEAKLIAEIGLQNLTNCAPGGGRGTKYLPPSLPITEEPEQEHIRFLRSLKMSKCEFDVTLRRWRTEKLNLLKNKRRRKTMFGRKYDTAQMDVEIERLTIALGLVIQYRLEDAEE